MERSIKEFYFRVSFKVTIDILQPNMKLKINLNLTKKLRRMLRSQISQSKRVSGK